MRIVDTRINGVVDPVGYCCDSLVCSWKVTEATSLRQTMAAVEVSLSPGFEDILWSRRGAELSSAGVRLDLALAPRTTYYYRVTVTGEGEEQAVSPVGTFETGKGDEPWTGEWIAPGDREVHPILRKTFRADKEVDRARLYVCGVGLFEAYLNGEKLGEEYLTPYVTNYEKGIQIITLPAQVREGENTLELLLGKGWYMGTFGLELQDRNYGGRMAAIGELRLEYADGAREVISTDGSWEWKGSDIRDSGIYDGEVLDRLLWADRENPWRPVEVLLDPENDPETRNLRKDHLRDRLSLPVLAMEDLPVREVIHTPAGETVLDLGQNFAGWVEFEGELPRGTEVTLDFGEILQGGNFYNKNYRDARSRFVYRSDGRRERVRPHFTFFGFRYVRVTGWPGEVPGEAFTGRAVYSALTRTGWLTTGHKKLDRLYENTLWGLKSNFLDLPTDCPQRSERLGWTGDAQVFAPTACRHMDTRAFFHKFIRDLMDEQSFLAGAVPNFVPNIGHKRDAGSVWGDIATLLPWTLFTAYGSLEELGYCWPMTRDWVDYIDRQDAARGERQYLFNFGFHFGDWLALDGATPTSFKGSTEDDYVASVYYFRSAQLAGEMAALLGEREEAARFRDLAEHIREAVLERWFTPAGLLAMDTQAAYVIALKFGIYRDREVLISQFLRRLKKDCYRIRCGFVGAPLLCTVLAEIGQVELAYDFLLNEDFPGWLHCVDLGATTVWERWNSVEEDGTISSTGMNSLNHYAYGSVMEFVYGYAAGIRPLEPGYRRAVIAPRPDIRLGHLECTYVSAAGTYVSNWAIREDGRVSVHVEVPFSCTAELDLPGDPLGKRALGAGTLDYTYTPERDFRRPYGARTTLRRLARDPAAVAVLGRYAPPLAGMALSGDPEMGSNTLEDISRMGFLPVDPAAVEGAIEALSQLTVVPAG